MERKYKQHADIERPMSERPEYFGLDPSKDFAPTKSLTEKQLSLIKWWRLGFSPRSRGVTVFSRDEEDVIRQQKRTTIRGERYKNSYLYEASGVRYAELSWQRSSVAQKYQPLINRIIRDEKRKILRGYGIYDDNPVTARKSIGIGLDEFIDIMRKVRILLSRLTNDAINKIDQRYGLHYQTKLSLGFDETALAKLMLIEEEEAEKRNCVVCGKRHNNKIRFGSWRLGNRKIHVYESDYPSANVQPHCYDCGEAYERERQKRLWKVEKAEKETKEIKSLFKQVKEEIKNHV